VQVKFSLMKHPVLKWSPAEMQEEQPGEAAGARAPDVCRWRGPNVLLVHRPGSGCVRTVSS